MDHLADAPVANILILAGVIFLAVGLFGRVGGFIGSIFGNIEAGKNSRVLAGVLGTFLIVGGGWLHEEGQKPAASNAQPAAPSATTPSASTTTPASIPSPASSAPAAGTTPSAVKPGVAYRSPKMTALAATRESLPTSPAPRVGADRLLGTWTNLTPRSDSIKKLDVVRSGQGLNVHVWYSCPSGDCDVGFHSLDTTGSTPTYEYNDSNRHRVGSLNHYSPGVVLLTMDLFDPGMQNHVRRNWVFVKSTASDKVQDAFSRYLSKPGHKAFAMAPRGMWSYHFGAGSDDAAAQSALKECEERGAPGCRILLLNDDAAE
jgi:hypothetical protein